MCKKSFYSGIRCFIFFNKTLNKKLKKNNIPRLEFIAQFQKKFQKT